MCANLSQTETEFHRIFGSGPAPSAVRAPGRVNLIGEHTDYNDGFVLPIAIDREITALVRPRSDNVVLLRSTAAEEAASVDLDGAIEPGEHYCRGVIALLRERGVALGGAEILFDSTIPAGGGLSSSAALEVATALAMREAAPAADWPGPAELARLCQQAEHAFAGAPCGIMDQSIVLMARAGCAMLLDCRTGEARHVPLDDPGVAVLVCDTQVSHELSDGGYAARRSQCEAAAAKLGLASLRDASAEQVSACEGLSDIERMRARHVVGEIARTVEAAAALEAGDYDGFGRLMTASHASLRDDYQVSCEQLNVVVEAATAHPDVYGARMTGGGFGGCAIALVRTVDADAIVARITEAFRAAFGRACPVFATHAAAGASRL